MHATTWMDLDNVTLSEKSRTWKTTCDMVPFVANIQNKQIDKDSKLVVSMGLGKKRCGVTAIECWASFWGDESILELGTGDGFTALNTLKNH